jgi:hypothetical protein
MGRHAREHGSALANMVFMSHGARQGGGVAAVFDTAAELQAAGFKPRYQEVTEIELSSLSEEQQLLFTSLHVAMISFAFVVNSNAALQNMRPESASKFRDGLGPSLFQSMANCGLVHGAEGARSAVLAHAKSAMSAGARTVLNLQRPASEDILEHLILRAVAVSGAKAGYGFVRTGATGFDVVAVPLVQETLRSIAGAILQYKW